MGIGADQLEKTPPFSLSVECGKILTGAGLQTDFSIEITLLMPGIAEQEIECSSIA